MDLQVRRLPLRRSPLPLSQPVVSWTPTNPAVTIDGVTTRDYALHYACSLPFVDRCWDSLAEESPSFYLTYALQVAMEAEGRDLLATATVKALHYELAALDDLVPRRGPSMPPVFPYEAALSLTVSSDPATVVALGPMAGVTARPVPVALTRHTERGKTTSLTAKATYAGGASTPPTIGGTVGYAREGTAGATTDEQLALSVSPWTWAHSAARPRHGVCLWNLASWEDRTPFDLVTARDPHKRLPRGVDRRVGMIEGDGSASRWRITPLSPRSGGGEGGSSPPAPLDVSVTAAVEPKLVLRQLPRRRWGWGQVRATTWAPGCAPNQETARLTGL